MPLHLNSVNLTLSKAFLWSTVIFKFNKVILLTNQILFEYSTSTAFKFHKHLSSKAKNIFDIFKGYKNIRVILKENKGFVHTLVNLASLPKCAVALFNTVEMFETVHLPRFKSFFKVIPLFGVLPFGGLTTFSGLIASTGKIIIISQKLLQQKEGEERENTKHFLVITMHIINIFNKTFVIVGAIYGIRKSMPRTLKVGLNSAMLVLNIGLLYFTYKPRA